MPSESDLLAINQASQSLAYISLLHTSLSHDPADEVGWSHAALAESREYPCLQL